MEVSSHLHQIPILDATYAVYRSMSRGGISEEDAQYILDECRNGRAVCFGSPDGAVIASTRASGDKLELLILLAVGYKVGTKLVDAYLHEIEDIARFCGACRITFQTRRKGWRRYLGADWQVKDGFFFRDI